ncbi:YjiH family protein [Cytobacillus sp. S13-E01]|uniref:YjiH family protein n=1 Tax=Cytobacillus sp. S13-E01 TaxID=3031326 RepID=UPI0023D80649|nr:YjiH family protein [Cytobacillus sp. S13-E01]MDF0728055.1 YjiH family protein [Cytobacillus sp. S13-E01]
MPQEPIVNSISNVLKFIGFSLIGIFVFFVPITVNGTSSIPLDHTVTWINTTFPSLTPIYALLLILGGVIYPFITKTWNQNIFNIVFSLLKIVGLAVGLIIYLKLGPDWLMNEYVGPFLFDLLVVPVGIMVPLGGVFLSLLIGYGLFEFIGVLFQRVMKPIWKTPGRSAVNAMASFVASFAVGILITNREFKEGKYTIKQAVIIATGFSTVTVSFMVIVAKTLDLMSIWNLYFAVTAFVTFLVTAITVRIWPISKIPDEYYNGMEGEPEKVIKNNYLQNAWKEAMEASNNAPNLGKNIWVNLRDGIIMTMNILPTILSIGLIGILLAEYTPIFDYIGYIFYPFTALLQLPDAFLTAKAAAIGVTEMFLPALLVVEAALVTKFVIAVVCVSSILFFSASIPCILATEIKISIPKLIVIWIERTILSLIIVTPLAYLLL